MPVRAPLASVVVPAHDEARSIPRGLTALLQGVGDDELELLVVCNGCTDDTAERARDAAPDAKVIEIPVPSKAEAMRVGNDAATAFPRVHLDADVVLAGPDLRRLVEPLRTGSAHAAAPRRVLVTDGCSAPVRWYYDVWGHLPQVEAGLFGRGAIALSEEGQRRVDALPPVMSDDLAASEAFEEGERLVVAGATIRVQAPRRVVDLVRRRARVVTGNVQADRLGTRRSEAATSWGDLATLVTRHPRLLPRLPVFLAVTAASRVLARRRVRASDFTTWLRDESSRS